MKNLIMILLAISLTACGPDAYYFTETVPGETGEKGDAGQDGDDGTSITLGTVVVEDIDRSTTPWDQYFTELDKKALVLIPTQIRLDGLSQNENGGWMDVYIGDETFCFQGQVGQKRYNFKYKKAENATQGCDSNSEKEADGFTLSATGKVGDKVGVVPRAPRLNGLVWSLELDAFLEE